MIGLPSFYGNNLPKKVRDDKKFTKLLTGLSIALIEAAILCPVERVKVYFMTKE
jgi:hypothetical protein